MLVIEKNQKFDLWQTFVSKTFFDRWKYVMGITL